MKNSFTRIIGIIGVFVIGVNVMGQSIVVNTDNYKQTIDMIGGDMERSSIAIQNAQNKQEIIEWSFKDINFNVCRVQYDKNQELVEGTKNWAFYDKQVATMQAIKQVNPNIKFFATLRSDYDGYGDDNNLPDWIVNYNTKVMQTDKYGIFLADYCEYMSQKGVPISILSTSKEWMWHVRPDKVPDILSKMYSELDERGIERPVISDQGFWSISQGITYLNYVKSLGTKDLYHSFCSHNYANESNEKWVEIIEMSNALGKPMYDDETSTGSGSPTYGEERAMYKQIGEYVKKANRYAAGLSGEIFFEIWSRGIDKETRSIYFPANGTGTRKRGYFLMKHFSNNILNSRYVTSQIAGMPNVYTISFRQDNQVVLWVINQGTSSFSHFMVGVDAYKIDGPVNLHYWNDNTPITGVAITQIARGNMFETAISGEGINCYIFKVKDEADNLALAGSATQSSTQDKGVAALAIDGNTDGVWENGSVSLTQNEEQPWWQLDLGENDTMGIIKVYKRTDMAISDFTVSVLDDADNVVFTQTISELTDSCISINSGGVIGQIIKVQSNSTTSLSLAEVQVFEGTKFEKLDQSIQMDATRTLSYTTEAQSPGAEASSGLNVNYSTSNPEVVTFSDGKMYIHGVGTATVTASVPESAMYKAATDLTQELTVTKAYQQISFDPLPVIKVGDGSFLLEATANSGLVVEYSSSDESVALIENYRIVIKGEGQATITASQAGNDLYNETSTTQLLKVEKSAGGSGDTTTVTLLPIHDSYVRGGKYASDNYGTETELLIKQTTNLDYKRITFLQFDLFDLDMVETAMLRLFAKSANTSQIVVYATTDDWKEGTITYNNAPKAGTAMAVQAVATAGKYYDWDVTAYVKNQMQGDDLASFQVADMSTNKNNIGFYSKEAGDNLPQLVITKKGTSNAIVNAGSLFKLYPNPTDGVLSIDSKNRIKEIRIVSIYGQEILQMNKLETTQIRFSLYEHLAGLYLVHVIDHKGIEYTQKLVKN